MNCRILSLVLLLVGGSVATGADTKLATLQVGSVLYSNVTVTTVTATDIFFTHAQGMGNAKLKLLDPTLQKQFHFDAAKAADTEKAQAEATAIYLRQAATNRPVARESRAGREELAAPTRDEKGELVAAQLYAKSFRGQRPPQIIVEQWLSPPPEVTNKFVLVELWTTWAAPAREAIPHLNELQARFKDRLVVIGLSNEPVEDMNKMTSPKVHYYVGTDPQSRTFQAFALQAVPHAVLIDPSGVVRYEGHSKQLNATDLEQLITRYSP